MSARSLATSLRLSGKVALVTGGGTGIGFMIAKGFVDGGAKVYITGRREQVLRDAATSLKDAPGVIVPLVMDVTSQQSIDDGVKFIQEAEDKLDILVNNAGNSAPTISEPEYFQKKMAHLASGGDPLAHESFEGWAEMFALNTAAPFFMITSFQNLLSKGAKARSATSSVINISSIASTASSWVTFLSYSYGLTKSALDKMTVGLAAEYAKRKIPIRVNGINPGQVNNGRIPQMMLEKEYVFPGYVAPIPLGRPALAADVAQTAIYLATSECTNGVMLKLDGGVTLVNP